MSQKPDYYAVLGVERTATEADIKKAFMRITMTCHPDALKNKQMTDEQRAEAEDKFKYGKEAQAVLLDPVKRAGYDKFGHAGVESMAKGQQPSGTPTGNAQPRPVRTRTNEEVFDFFDRAAERNGTASRFETPAETGTAVDEDEMRRAAREARRRNRGQSQPDIGSSAYVPPKAEPAPVPAAEKPAAPKAPVPATPAQPSGIFDEVAGKVSQAADRLRAASANEEVVLPAAVLEKFRDNLQDFIGEVDSAIRQARRAPGGGYNR